MPCRNCVIRLILLRRLKIVIIHQTVFEKHPDFRPGDLREILIGDQYHIRHRDSSALNPLLQGSYLPDHSKITGPFARTSDTNDVIEQILERKLPGSIAVGKDHQNMPAVPMPFGYGNGIKHHCIFLPRPARSHRYSYYRTCVTLFSFLRTIRIIANGIHIYIANIILCNAQETRVSKIRQNSRLNRPCVSAWL